MDLGMHKTHKLYKYMYIYIDRSKLTVVTPGTRETFL